MLGLIITAIFAYIFSLTAYTNFLPQLVALLSILFIVFSKYRLPTIYPISAIVNLIVFCSGGVTSPFFFLMYFLLFVTAITLHPLTSILFSLTSILLLSQSLNSYISLIPIFSLIFITPIVWFVSRQNQTIIREETDVLLWLNLKFKNGIISIIDSTSQIQSTPLTYTQKTHLKNIKDSAKSLLHSAKKLSDEI